MAKYRVHQICTEAAKADTLAFMAAIGAAGGFAGNGYSADGAAPATHRGVSTQLNDNAIPGTSPAVGQMAAVEAGAVTVNGVPYTLPAESWFWKDDDARLAAQQLFRNSNYPGTAAVIGQPWTFGNCLADVGLQPVV